MFKEIIKEILKEEMKIKPHVESNNVSSIKISILQRGWVIVGELRKEGNYYISENSSVIRQWGTTKGIGEIALNGPTNNTILDACGTVKFHELTSVAIIDCSEDLWKDKI